ncbi:MAG: DUF551 domain-containing protein [Desulfuromonadaceae bacterium]|nr:DUF551 domain-containing protein [Desulfuromonadaceae bacterium]
MKWIDAKDGLPNDSESVLLFTPYPIFGDDHTCVGNKEGLTKCTCVINKEQVPIFTHWMPLPPKPEQDS